MRPLLVFLMLSAVALAGCTGDGDNEPVTSADCLEQDMILGEDEDGNPACVEPPFVIEEFENSNHYCVVNEHRDRLHAPDLVGDPWVLGQSWTYSLDVDGNTSTTKLIYYADQEVGADLPLHYMVGTPTREEALVQAINSINPVIGRVHSVLYSPHESGDHADMFHFPLCEGSSWQTVFYGETFTLTAAKDGSDRKYSITGTSSEGSTLRIHYDADVQWFTLIDLDRANGETVTMELQSTGSGETGEAFFLRGQKDEVVDVSSLTPNGPDGQEVTRSDGGDGPYDTVGIAVEMERISGNGFAELNIYDPSGVSVLCVSLPGEGFGQDPDCLDSPVLIEVPFVDGTWEVKLATDLIDPAEVAGEARMVSIYDRSCTVGGDCLS